MSKYRRFEIVADKINHVEKSLGLNEAISVIMLESQLIPKEQWTEIYVCIAKLEYIRTQRLYTKKLGDALYQILWDVFNEKSKLEQIVDLGLFLDKFLKENNRELKRKDYEKMAPSISRSTSMNEGTLRDYFREKFPSIPPSPQPALPEKPPVPVVKRESKRRRVIRKTKILKRKIFRKMKLRDTRQR